MRFKRLASIVFGVSIAVAVFAVIVEIIDTNSYNITHIDPASGLPLYTPGSVVHERTGCFESDAQINNLGFHGPEVSIQKPANVFRVVVVGSSYVEARQVSVPQMFTSLLEQKLNAMSGRSYGFEVIPLGFNGNSTRLTDLYYKQYGAALRPDLVIDVETAHELYALDAAPLDATGRAILVAPPPQKDSNVRTVLRRSKFLINLYSRFLTAKNSAQAFIEHPFSSAAESAPTSMEFGSTEAERWNIQTPLIAAMARLTKESNAKLLFTTFTTNEYPVTADAEFVRHSTDLAKTYAFAYYNLTPRIVADEQTGPPATYIPCDGHWTPAGHQYVAQALYEYLIAHPQLIAK